MKKLVAKLMQTLSSKEVEARKLDIVDQLSAVARDSKELHAANFVLLECYLSKRTDYIVDIISSVSSETVAVDLLKLLTEHLLSSHRDFTQHSSGPTVNLTIASRAFENLCSILELLLKVASRGPWWNERLLATCQMGLKIVAEDENLDSACAVAVVYIVSICVPYSIAQLDDKMMSWLCQLCSSLLNRVFSGRLRGVKQSLAEDAMKCSLMQLVLILYGVFPITFLKHLMQACPNVAVEYVVSQLRLHPILSQHLAQRANSEIPQQQQQQQQPPQIQQQPPPQAQQQQQQQQQQQSSPGLNIGVEGKGKNRFKGKDFSDIVTECLNYEATSPPKMFSADFPNVSMLAANANKGPDQNSTVDVENDSELSQPRAIPTWCHADKDAFFYSCPDAPSPLQLMQKGLQNKQKIPERSQNDITEPVDEVLTVLQQQSTNGAKEANAGPKSLGQVNSVIREMLSQHRQPSILHEPTNDDIPQQYVRSFTKLQHMRSSNEAEVEVLREQLKLSQLSLAFERHRQLIFICKNRSLMADHKKMGELSGHFEELQRRLYEIETELDQERQRRVVSYRKTFF